MTLVMTNINGIKYQYKRLTAFMILNKKPFYFLRSLNDKADGQKTLEKVAEELKALRSRVNDLESMLGK